MISLTPSLDCPLLPSPENPDALTVQSVLNFHYHPSSASSGDPDAKNREKTREEETRTLLEGSLTIEVFLISGEPLPPQLLALTRIEVLTAEDIQ